MKKLMLLGLMIVSLLALAACGNPATPEAGAAVQPAAASDDTPVVSAAAEGGYKNTLTVSTILELAESIGNDTRIILKAGEYNFSQLAASGFDNPHLQDGGYIDNPEYTVYGVSNLAIEAEPGAAVEIVTENPYVKVLTFRYCSGIRLQGLVCGHKTEPGGCMGSVIGVERVSDLVIRDCELYGCGTYGLEAYQAEKISLSGCQIYECSSGVVSLYDIYDISFSGCRFHDNSCGQSLFSISDSYNVVFTDTEIDNNDNPEAFLSGDYTFVYFNGCLFHDNATEPEPEALKEYASFENCDIPAR